MIGDPTAGGTDYNLRLCTLLSRGGPSTWRSKLSNRGSREIHRKKQAFFSPTGQDDVLSKPNANNRGSRPYYLYRVRIMPPGGPSSRRPKFSSVYMSKRKKYMQYNHK